MQLTNKPSKIVLPFANAGAKNTIPAASQIGIVAGAASLTDGFPPLTRTDIVAGGIPPSGLDMNGILFGVSAIARWSAAGGGYPWDTTFANDVNVGGYPKGARVLRSDGVGYWLNTVENNITDPEGATSVADGWLPDLQSGQTAITMTNANVTLTPLQYGKDVISITGILTANVNLIFPAISKSWVVINNTTGAFTITAKTASGSGVALSTTTQIVGDGVNILPTFVQTVSNTVGIQGAVKNLQASATGLSANVTVTADEVVVEDTSNVYKTLRAVSLTVAGTTTGINALDTGTIAASTWYYLWVIYNGTTTAGLLSLSSTAPTMPGGYTYKALVGAVVTDASGNKYPLSFSQKGKRWAYKVAAGSNVTELPALITGVQGNPATPTWAAASVTPYVPTNASEIFVTLVGATVANQAAIAAPNNQYGAVGATTNPPPIMLSNGTGMNASNTPTSFLLESTNVYYASTSASHSLRCSGFILNT